MPLNHPYSNLERGSWLRGNLHAHSTQSDGALDPQAVIRLYAQAGYKFLSLSDHDFVTAASDYPRKWDTCGLILIGGNEVTADGPHMLHVSADRKVEPDWRRQAVINEANRSPGSFVIVNHPNWQQHFDHASISLLQQWTGYVGIEIFNGIIRRDEGSGYALDKWDMLLSAGKRVWGFAHDDFHIPIDFAQGWDMAYVTPGSSESPTPTDVVETLRAGRFYASTGVTITGIHVDQLRIRIETQDADRIVCVGRNGKRFGIADDKSIEVDVPSGETNYVRFECYGRGENRAWTQPFFVSDV